jgi:Protein of unknown function (DUF998)
VSRQGRILASACGLALFLVVVAVQPLLEQSYDPLRQGISEFVHTDARAVVLIGFVAWAVSLALLAAVLSGDRAGDGRRRAIRLEVDSLLAAVAGLGLVALFATDRGAEAAGTITETTISGRLHDIGSALITVAILAAVVADALHERDPRLAATVIAAALGSSLVLFAFGDPLPGLRQRCLIASACLWQVAVLHRAWSRAPTSERSSAGSRCSTS